MCDSPLPISDLQDYEPPISLWDLVEQHVPDHERGEVKQMLGESLVEQSLELHQEITALVEIWRDYREETQETLTATRLPEPPAVRERLKQEIKFFVKSIREKAKQNGRDAEKILSSHKAHVIEYALDRPVSAGSQTSRSDGRSSAMRMMTPDRGSAISDEVESMSDKLNFLKVDETVQYLRKTLEEEIQQLLADINYIQGCLEEEVEFRSESRMSREPTLTDLREERSKLEKEMMTPDVPEGLRDKPVEPPHLRKLKPQLSSGALKFPSPPSSAKSNSGKPSPMKASYQPPTNKDSPPSSANPLLPSNSRLSRMQYPGPGTAANPSHITIRTSDIPGSAKAKLVSVSVAAKGIGTESSSPTLEHTPSPPNSAKPTNSRPGSASRFRKMVLECRDA